jgi:protoporphyrinogen oxidase
MQDMSQDDTSTEFVVLGGGLSGLSLARQLAARHHGKVVVLERNAQVGGLAKGLEWHGIPLDLGSHRIHSGFQLAALQLIEQLLDGDLRTRKRKGSILVNGEFLHYPPSLATIATSFGLRQSVVFLKDFVEASLTTILHATDQGSFESYLRGNIGDSLYECFYRPYAEKLWGLPPDQISFEPAVARLHRVRGLRTRSKRDLFYYPKGGMGQIAEALRKEIGRHGGTVLTGAEVTELHFEQQGVRAVARLSHEDRVHTVRGRTCISTLPLRATWGLAGLLPEELPLRWRSLRVVYLLYAAPFGGDIDTYYFPDPRLRIGRVSSIHRFNPDLPDPANRILTVEIPCSESDDLWTLPEQDLAHIVQRELLATGVVNAGHGASIDVKTVDLRDVYPIYELGWRERWAGVMERFSGFDRLFLAGRSALFLHCNIDHCMTMSQRLSACMESPEARTEWRAAIDAYPLLRLKE